MKKVQNHSPDYGKKKRRIIIAIIILLCVLYIFFAARPLSSEIHFVPAWTIDVDKNSRNERVLERLQQEDGAAKLFVEAIPYKLGQTAGYFTKNGTVLSYFTFSYKAAVSEDFYTLYGTHSSDFPVFEKTGKESMRIKQTGFPYFSSSSLFLFLPGGASFSRIGYNGEAIWTHEGRAPITAFSSSEGGVLAGFADGRLVAFDGSDGSVLYSISPGGSEYPVILGAGISPSGELVASVSGQDKQRFVIAKKADGRADIIFHKYLENETNRQVIVKFSKNEESVYYSYADGLGIVNCKTFADSKIAIEGEILSIQEDEDGTAFVLSRDGGVFTVSVVEPFDVYSGSFSFEAEHAFIAVKDGSLFVGHDSKISRIDIKHK